ncbi:dihydropteroate synthase [Phycicoccus endophyticus]|uniref:dihydropteroate synthase n=1 Tax=Phycicoccus endophyticus TaxID=1690220 RepID=UPI00140E2E78|nr:dihydropteroate synthase [Phycicoccus endophyticus]NHI19990.1 dihydropteroate synthase [Phycicoccus endophyticus]GGL42806.1 dihydropteroate synthase [Phycicoccus endophyticus]
MGVVNVTPDSFSDGGQWFQPEDAVAHGRVLRQQGADVLDVGGESTRPGAQRPTQEEELRRVLPVVEALCAVAPVSVDTMRAAVAAAALDAGASLVNDVSGGLADPEMVPLVAERGVAYVAMHWRGHSARMQSRARYDDVVADVLRELGERVEQLLGAGVRPEHLVLDPGFGFAKTPEHSWELLRRLEELTALGHPVLVGTSRKGFLGAVGRAAGAERAPLERDVATAVTTVHAATHGAWGVRVHDVVATLDALDVAETLAGGPR